MHQQHHHYQRKRPAFYWRLLPPLLTIWSSRLWTKASVHSPLRSHQLITMQALLSWVASRARVCLEIQLMLTRGDATQSSRYCRVIYHGARAQTMATPLKNFAGPCVLRRGQSSRRLMEMLTRISFTCHHRQEKDFNSTFVHSIALGIHPYINPML